MVSSPAVKAPPVLALLAALLAAACASPDRQELRTAVDLGPGGRAEGTMALRGIGLPDLRLVRRGPGAVGHVVRTPSGRVLSDGPLERLHLVYDDASCAEGEAVIVLEAAAGEPSVVAVTASGIGGVGLKWDLSRAHPGTVPPAERSEVGGAVPGSGRGSTATPGTAPAPSLRSGPGTVPVAYP